jgi:tetratricopeptide (TPR) repeat protein
VAALAALLGVVAAAPAAAEGGADWMVRARAFSARGDHAQALSALERARELDPNLPGLDLSLGLAAFELERWEEAREALSLAADADPENGSALLLLGLCELALDEPDAAVAAFRSARLVTPRLAQASFFHEGLAHSNARRAAQAREALERAIELDPEARLAARARSLLVSVERRAEAGRRFRLSAATGVEYASNVSVPEVDASSGQGDGAAVAEISSSYRLLEGERGSAEAGYDFSQSLHFELSEADQQAHGFWLDGTRELGPVEGGLGYRFTTTTLDGDAFLNLHQVRPRLLVPLLSWWSAELSAGYLNKDFRTDAERDAHHASLGVESFFSLPDRRPRLRAGLSFEAEDARGDEYDYLGFALGTGVRVPFTWRGEWTLDLGYRLKLRDYTHETASIGETRLDWDHGAVLGLSRKLGRHLELRTDYRLTNAVSNLPSADYLDHTVGMRLRASL